MWVGGEVNKKLDWKLRCVEGKEKSWIGKWGGQKAGSEKMREGRITVMVSLSRGSAVWELLVQLSPQSLPRFHHQGHLTQSLRPGSKRSFRISRVKVQLCFKLLLSHFLFLILPQLLNVFALFFARLHSF
jgi:hypothetical protein